MTLCALPVALAFIWDRLTTIKVAGFEVSLAASAPVTSDQLRDQLKDAQRFPLGLSGYPDIKTAIRNATGDLIEINLGDTEWWSTRLFLIAALTQDYTSVKQLLFVDRCNNPRVCFVGFSTPATTRRALAAVHPNLEQAYRQAKSNIGQPIAGLDLESEVEALIANLWVGMAGQNEMAIKQQVSADWLRRVLKGDLAAPQVEWPGSETSLLRYLILQQNAPFVAVVQGPQLIQVVDRCTLATQVSSAALRALLQGL